MKTSLVVIALFSLLLVAHATPRQEINYQGQLTYSNGDPIDSTVAITFDIYVSGSGGTSLWSETHGSVTVQDGVFDVVLGSSNALPDTMFANNDSLYIQSTLGSTIISPRTRLTSVPWAFDAATLDGVDGSGYSSNPHDHLGETWNNIGGSLGLAISGGGQGFVVIVDSTAFRGKASTADQPVILGENTGGTTQGSIGTMDRGGITRPASNVGAEGSHMSTLAQGSLGTDREGVFGADTDNGVEGAIACMAEPQLGGMGMPIPAGVYGYAARPGATGGEFYNDALPSVLGAGDDWALIIGQGHLSAAGMNPGLNPTTPSPGLGPANVASIVLGGPVPWINGPSPVTLLGASWVFIPDPNITNTSLIWVFPSVVGYPAAAANGPPVGTWFLDTVGNIPLMGQGFIVGSTAVEGPVDFIYWVVN